MSVPWIRICEYGGLHRKRELLLQMESSLWISCKVSASWPKNLCVIFQAQLWAIIELTHGQYIGVSENNCSQELRPFWLTMLLFFVCLFWFVLFSHSYPRCLHSGVSWGKDFLRYFWQGCLMEGGGGNYEGTLYNSQYCFTPIPPFFPFSRPQGHKIARTFHLGLPWQ